MLVLLSPATFNWHVSAVEAESQLTELNTHNCIHMMYVEMMTPKNRLKILSMYW